MGTTSENTIQNRIEDCEKPYHLCAQIQPHGIFCAIDPVSFKIIRISANAAAFFGREADAILGSNFGDVLTPESADKLNAFVAIDRGKRKSRILTFTDPPGITADAFLYRSGSLLCIEFELCRPDAATIEVASSRFFELVERIAQTDVSSALPGIACEAIRDILGVDRVYYIQFDRHGHGHVPAESRNEVLAGLLDHHFPATDIPAAARRMFLFNPFRLIPDADAPPVAILGGDGTPLDLTMSACRAVAEAHLQYNRNMGVIASCSFPVTRDGNVEALFGGHHATARQLSFRQMMIARHLAELFKSRYDFLKAREERALLAERVETLYALSGSFEAADHDLGAFITGHHDAFCALMDADDIICRYSGQSHFGHSLAMPDAARLLEFLGSKLAKGPNFYQTDCIGDDDAQFASLCPAVAGVCAVALDRFGSSIVAWLRRELVTVQKWGGDPHLPKEINEEGSVGPRTSFLTYMREVKGTSRQWPSVSADLARQLRHVFTQVLANHYEIGMRKAAKAEAERQKLETIGRMAGGVAHEINNLLQPIAGMAETGLDDLAPEDALRENFTVILDCARQAASIVRSILTYVRQQTPKAHQIALGKVVEEHAAMIRSILLPGEYIELNLADTETLVLGDEGEAGQILLNLVQNACHAMGGAGTVGVALAKDGEGKFLRLTVSDTGCGMSAEVAAHAFEPFFSTKPQTEGTGLGLAVVQGIVRDWGGNVSLDTAPGQGTRVHILLPVAAG